MSKKKINNFNKYKNTHLFYLLSIVLLFQHNGIVKSDVNSCTAVKSTDASEINCGKHDDKNGYCCLVRATDVPVETKSCQYFINNSTLSPIFSGYNYGKLNFLASCNAYKEIKKDFPLHDYINCGKLVPTSLEDCTKSNIYPKKEGEQAINCCKAKANFSNSIYCVKTDFSIEIKANYTLYDDNLEVQFECSEKMFRLNFKTILSVIILLIIYY